MNGNEGGYIHLTTNPEFALKGLTSFISSSNYSYIDDLCLTNNDTTAAEKDNFFDEFDNYSAYDTTDFRKKWTNNYLADKGSPAEKAHNNTDRLSIVKDPKNLSNKVLKVTKDGGSDTFVTTKEYFVQNFTMEFAFMLDESTEANSWFGFMLNKDYHKDGMPWGSGNSTNFSYLLFNGYSLYLYGSAYVNATNMGNFTIEDSNPFSINKGQWVTIKVISTVENDQQVVSFYGNNNLIGKYRTSYNVTAGFISLLNCNTTCYIDDLYIKYANSSSNNIREDFSYDSYGEMGVRWNNYYLADPSSSSAEAAANNNDVFQITTDPDNANNSVIKMDSITKPTVGSSSYLTIKKLYTREFDLSFNYYTTSSTYNSSWIGVEIHKDFRNDKAYYEQNGILLLLQTNPEQWTGTRFNAIYFEMGSTGRIEQNVPVQDSHTRELATNTWHTVNITADVAYNSELDLIDTLVTMTVDGNVMGNIVVHNSVLSMHGSISLTNTNYIGLVDDVEVTSRDSYTLNQLADVASVDKLSDIAYEADDDLVIPFNNKGVEVTKVTLLMPEYHLDASEFSYIDGYLSISLKAFRNYEAGEYQISIRTGDGIHIGTITTAKITLTSNLPYFLNTYLKMYEIPTSDNRDTGACRGVDGYYAEAKAYYNTLSNEDKATFETSYYEEAIARYVAWGNANNDATPLAAKLTPIVESFNNNINYEANSTILIVLSIVAASSSLLLVLSFVRKRKSHRNK